MIEIKSGDNTQNVILMVLPAGLLPGTVIPPIDHFGIDFPQVYFPN